MAKLAESLALQSIPTLDLGSFTRGAAHAELVEPGKRLVEVCHRLGFVKISGHGVSTQEIQEALAWVKRLFDLPYEDKMKAPHPPGNMPHRGYSPIGMEKVYSKAEAATHSSGSKVAESLRSISDYKESYEIGSNQNDQQQNIWLPEEVLPHFMDYMTSLYERLAGVADMIIEAYAIGLDLTGEDYTRLTNLHSRNHNQLRLLHYPEINKEKLESNIIARLPAHQDWGTFTMLFQDERGGLELQDPQTLAFLHAQPEEGTLLLNVGDMLERFTNGYFMSATHRVALPPPDLVTSSDSIPARYSIPYFVAPHPEHVIETSQHFVSEESPSRYEVVKFQDYGGEISKYQYKEDAN